MILPMNDFPMEDATLHGEAGHADDVVTPPTAAMVATAAFAVDDEGPDDFEGAGFGFAAALALAGSW